MMTVFCVECVSVFIWLHWLTKKVLDLNFFARKCFGQKTVREKWVAAISALLCVDSSINIRLIQTTFKHHITNYTNWPTISGRI